MNLKQVFSILALAMLAVTPTSAEQETSQGEDTVPSVWLIGDSTVKNGGKEGKGWGEVLHPHFDLGSIHVHNRAIGGRSSRTFRTEGRWGKVLEEARPGDFVLIQFGHNDGIAPDNPDRPRGTLRGIGDETVEIIHPHTNEPETVYTYGWYMRQYVKEAQVHGLIPIVCSYVPRAPRRGETPNPELSSYGLWAKEVAEQEDAAFLDLFGTIARAYQKIEANHPHGVKEELFVGGDRDYTHTNRAGAELNAQIVAELIRRLDGDAGRLSAYLKD